MRSVFRVVMAVGSVCFFTVVGWVVMGFINLTYMNAPDTIPPAQKLVFQLAGPVGFGIGCVVALLILPVKPNDKVLARRASKPTVRSIKRRPGGTRPRREVNPSRQLQGTRGSGVRAARTKATEEGKTLEAHLR